MTAKQFSPKQVFEEPVDALLADVAIRVQLSPSAYNLAVHRHEAVKAWIERPASQLCGRVELFYPQGSMATGSTVASKLHRDEFDIDIVAALLIDAGTAPNQILDLLWRAIRGESGSRYFEMVERRTRCVTVHYADNMHLDVTPMVRRPGTPERESWLYHHHQGTPGDLGRRLIANPYGFALWFNDNTPLDSAFALQYEERLRAYEQMMMAGSKDDDPIPPQEPLGRKSMAVIVLQLMKRWRNVQYDRRPGRRPPSILMSKLVADNAGQTQTLSQELLHQARRMLAAFEKCQMSGRLIHEANPVCPEDLLTDRWPLSAEEQSQFIGDLQGLVADANRLVSGCSLDEMKAILTRLFGEHPTGAAIEAYVERFGKPIREGTGRHKAGKGRLVVPAVGLTPAARHTPSIKTPSHTHYGDGPSR